MEAIEKINKLKKQIKEEQENGNPDSKKINKWVNQIAYLGIGLDINNGQKSFTHV